MNASPAVSVPAESVLDDSTDTVYDKRSWQAVLNRSAKLFDKSRTEHKTATNLLWTASKSGIEEWLPLADSDKQAERFAGEVLAILGKTRKGDASKIKTVALATKNHGLVLSIYPSLTKAYNEARRLTQTVQAEKAEDAAADKAIEELAARAPKTTATPEGAAMLVLSLGLDEAARLLLDALGSTNEAAHRAFMRAISQEIAGRVKPKVSTVKAGPKAGATQASSKGAQSSKAKPNIQPASAKGKPAAVAAAAPVKPTAAPVVQKGKPVMKGKPVTIPAKAV